MTRRVPQVPGFGTWVLGELFFLSFPYRSQSLPAGGPDGEWEVEFGCPTLVFQRVRLGVRSPFLSRTSFETDGRVAWTLTGK